MARARIVVHKNTIKIEMVRFHAKTMLTILEEVVEQARVNANTGPYSRGGLALSIGKTGPLLTGFNARGFVGASASYAASVETGAKQHNIFPKSARNIWRFGDRSAPQLRFFWRGKLVFTPHVPMTKAKLGRSHPGQSGKHYLLKAVLSVAVRHRLGVRIKPRAV